ncbi:uncharacterized protein F5147DRAFT_22608 [Suillus discolor]|uniref:Uncharacterized protein n=1 Tax=Suillus discolor TaxID=1912936 RepID=A0A9P7FCN5_9AGAM|nr:uncharacterized protein F5147DRAFT_22608 [Suillus discolor]KAG2114301.1 hypothetical protein F5147DRAFT_22608 [Suillus discolor]
MGHAISIRRAETGSSKHRRSIRHWRESKYTETPNKVATPAPIARRFLIGVITTPGLYVVTGTDCKRPKVWLYRLRLSRDSRLQARTPATAPGHLLLRPNLPRSDGTPRSICPSPQNATARGCTMKDECVGLLVRGPAPDRPGTMYICVAKCKNSQKIFVISAWSTYHSQKAPIQRNAQGRSVN